MGGVWVELRSGPHAVLFSALVRAAACCLCALTACATAPEPAGLVDLHEQALSLGRPAGGGKVDAEADVSDILRRR